MGDFQVGFHIKAENRAQAEQMVKRMREAFDLVESLALSTICLGHLVSREELEEAIEELEEEEIIDEKAAARHYFN